MLQKLWRSVSGGSARFSSLEHAHLKRFLRSFTVSKIFALKRHECRAPVALFHSTTVLPGINE
jgi:hypothetical protein